MALSSTQLGSLLSSSMAWRWVAPYTHNMQISLHSQTTYWHQHKFPALLRYKFELQYIYYDVRYRLA